MYARQSIFRLLAAAGLAATLPGCLTAMNADNGASNSASQSVPLTFVSGQIVSANRDVANAANSLVLPKMLAAYGGKPSSAYQWAFTQTPVTGLSVDAGSGVVTGTLPSNATSSSYFFYATVSDGVTPAQSGHFTLQVTVCDSSPTRPSGNPACTSSTLASGNGVGSPISVNGDVGLSQVPTQLSFGYSLRGSGGTPPYKNWTWTAVTPTNTLPPGLTLDPTSGLLWGTPASTAAGTTYTFDVTVTDSANTTSPASRYTITF